MTRESTQRTILGPSLRSLLSICLVFSVFALVTPLQGLSQSVSTVGTTLYSSNTSATTMYSTSRYSLTDTAVLQYVHGPYDYDPSTGAFTLGGELTRKIKASSSDPFMIWDQVTCLYYDFFVFHASTSQNLRGHFEAGRPMNFYIVTVDQLEDFSGSDCGLGSRALYVRMSVFSLDWDWVVPQDGVYGFLLTSHAPSANGLPVYFAAQTYNSTLHTATFSYASTTTQVIQYVKTILSSQASSTVVQSSSPDLILVLLAALGLIILVGVIAVKVRLTRKSR